MRSQELYSADNAVAPGVYRVSSLENGTHVVILAVTKDGMAGMSRWRNWRLIVIGVHTADIRLRLRQRLAKRQKKLTES